MVEVRLCQVRARVDGVGYIFSAAPVPLVPVHVRPRVEQPPPPKGPFD